MEGHRNQVKQLRVKSSEPDITLNKDQSYLAVSVAADLLELHDGSGIDLDQWPNARGLVESLIDEPI